MIWKNITVDYHVIHSVAKAHIIVFNDISTFFEPTSPTNIMTNETILTQYRVKQGLRVFGKKLRLWYKNSCSSSMTAKFLSKASSKPHL